MGLLLWRARDGEWRYERSFPPKCGTNYCTTVSMSVVSVVVWGVVVVCVVAAFVGSVVAAVVVIILQDTALFFRAVLVHGVLK